MKLQTILKPNKDICKIRELYFHEEDGFLLADGFFNLFYIEKHKIYTTIDSLYLHLKLHGWQEIVLMHDREEIRHIQLTQEHPAIDIEFPYSEYDDGVFWFKLRRAETAFEATAAEPEAGTYSSSGAAESNEISAGCMDADAAQKDHGHTVSCAEGSKAYAENNALEYVLEGYFEGTSSSAYNVVNIAVDICTYRREAYVIRNMRNVIERVFCRNAADKDTQSHTFNDEYPVSASKTDISGRGIEKNAYTVRAAEDTDNTAAQHLHFMLIDNGQTLHENDEFIRLTQNENRISLYPNKNAGGAGGFTRGMLEALKRNDEFTHVLLMDDDAVFDPDIFIRLYGLLSMLKPEYKGITVGGGLMREDMPQYQFASGEYYKDGLACNPYPMKDMTVYANCTSQYMVKPLEMANSYSGWWCCCFSMETVRKDNLPLPVFIHCDDIEYGIRNQSAGIIFMNGICVWHKGFEFAFPGANRYYDVRNKLITGVLHGNGGSQIGASAALKTVLKAMTATLISYRYAETRTAYRALEDFCRGTKWLYELDAEELNNSLRAMIHFKPYDELKAELGEQTYKLVRARLDELSAESRMESAIKKRYGIEGAGETAACKTIQKDGAAVQLSDDHARVNESSLHIPLISANDRIRPLFKHSRAVLYDPTSGKAVIAGRAPGELLSCLALYIKAVFLAAFRFNKAATDYRAHIQEISSGSSWEKYLGI